MYSLCFLESWYQVWRFSYFVCQSIFKETGISPEIDFQKALKGKKDMCNVCKIESVNQKQNVCWGLSLKSLFQRQVHIPSIHSIYILWGFLKRKMFPVLLQTQHEKHQNIMLPTRLQNFVLRMFSLEKERVFSSKSDKKF